jgi:hypothetical protein
VEDWVARRLCKYSELGEEAQRFAWVLAGRVVGNGPDHEPLVDAVRPMACVSTVALDQAKRLYQERFAVSQNSQEQSWSDDQG